MALQIKATNKADLATRWFDFSDDIKIKVASFSRPEYQIGVERSRRIVERKEGRMALNEITVDDGDLSEHDIQSNLMGHYLVLDWQGNITDEAGDKVDYSPEQAAALLKSNPAFMTWVIQKSIVLAAELDEEHEDITGKPKPATSGKKSGATKAASKKSSTKD